MRIARVRIESMATPVLAFEADGAVYDVAVLEAAAGPAVWSTADFHSRVIAIRCAGLEPLYERLRAGHRPTAARLPPGSYLPLPPCDTDRAALLQLGPYDLGAEQPQLMLSSARIAVGEGQPVPFPPGSLEPDFEAGLAAVLGDDLWRASPAQAQRAVLGYTMVLDWTAWHDEPWHARPLWRDAPSQLGPTLVTDNELGRLPRLRAEVRVGEERWSAGMVGDWAFSPADSLAFASQHVDLRAGDVVGLGRFLMGSPRRVGRRLAFGERVAVSVERLGTLTGWAVPAPPPVRWHERPLPGGGASEG